MGLNAPPTSESTWLGKCVMCNDHNDTNMDSGNTRNDDNYAFIGL